ncbi:hypothetical protein FHT91_001753 [Rhizobium sp. BK347]|nr:hypothetical protein [Rhizobium sp. BK252]MBB3401956.1 hypothetical protein [Rhizobium sp. BK289]MBB3414100.1 hypothetical protein [Rhizobium sp. BK284]MBB3481987.1 hypothetical protein [Rhizobium sp. BK347]
MPILTVRDDTRLYYKDWGSGPPGASIFRPHVRWKADKA